MKTTRSTVGKNMNLSVRVHVTKKGTASYDRKAFKNRRNWES